MDSKFHKITQALLLVFIVLFSMVRCHTGEQVISVNLDNAKEDNDPSIYEDLRHIKFLQDVYVSLHYILIYHDDIGELCLYDKERNYLRTITKLGQSEEECIAVITCEIDEPNGLIYVLDWEKVKKYSLKGDLLTAFRVPLSDGLALLPDGSFLLHYSVENNWVADKRAAKAYVFYDSLGVEYTAFPNTIQFTRKTVPSLYVSDFVSYSFEDRVYVKDRRDTLFCIQESRLVPKYVFTGSQSFSNIDALDEDSYRRSYRIENMLETSSSLLFETIESSGQSRQWHFDKKRHSLVFTRKPLIDTISFLSGRSTRSSSSLGPDVLTEKIDGVSFKMIRVPTGMYVRNIEPEQTMGNRSDIYLNSYYIGETEVTQALWRAVTGEYHSSYKQNDRHPVGGVSWIDAQRFITQVNTLSKKKFRLPTEAEWEFAAGGAQRHLSKWSGTDDINELMDYACFNSSSPAAVKSRRPNSLGIYDMSGNMLEWCSDWYNPYSEKREQENPQGGSKGVGRVAKGGCFAHDESYVTIAHRDGIFMRVGFGISGFRLAMDAD